MRGLLLLTTICLLALAQPSWGQPSAQLRSDAPDEIEFMDPESIYSFRGLDGHGLINRKPINIPQPTYDLKETGLVVLIFTITPAGTVSTMFMEPGQAGFASREMRESAFRAVEQWRFNPLSVSEPQVDQEVRVLIQFNHKGSGRLYSAEGNFILEGIDHRFPTFVPIPDYELSQQGTVTAEITLEPDGSIAWINRYYGETPREKVNPHLGIITHRAVSQWSFTALPKELPQEQSSLKIICRYYHWPDNESATARKAALRSE